MVRVNCRIKYVTNQVMNKSLKLLKYAKNKKKYAKKYAKSDTNIILKKI